MKRARNTSTTNSSAWAYIKKFCLGHLPKQRHGWADALAFMGHEFCGIKLFSVTKATVHGPATVHRPPGWIRPHVLTITGGRPPPPPCTSLFAVRHLYTGEDGSEPDSTWVKLGRITNCKCLYSTAEIANQINEHKRRTG